MGKDKLKRFAENTTFRCIIEPPFEDIFRKDHQLKGNWNRDFFKNENPIVLELGCGRGEYTVAMGERYRDKNFIGVDIKGARIWRGAKTATENSMQNIAFLRTRIEFIDSFFAHNEVSEIWITFPDPQLRQTRVKKRLTSPQFLALYASFLDTEGSLHLKTDSQHLYLYTKCIAEGNSLEISEYCNDIYGTGYANELLSIKTTYETKFLGQGLPITYMRMKLGDKCDFTAIEYAPDNELQR